MRKYYALGSITKLEKLEKLGENLQSYNELLTTNMCDPIGSHMLVVSSSLVIDFSW